jgi:predicted enzyme related to lactoylglutathione lyase
MKRVTGLGGVFFKTNGKEQLMAWYKAHLGLDTQDFGLMFKWREAESPAKVGYTVWSPFAKDTDYFAPSEKPFMFNYRVADLVGLIAALKHEGVKVVGDVEQHENGKFAWVLDPEGNKIELWEPVAPEADPYL